MMSKKPKRLEKKPGDKPKTPKRKSRMNKTRRRRLKPKPNKRTPKMKKMRMKTLMTLTMRIPKRKKLTMSCKNAIVKNPMINSIPMNARERVRFSSQKIRIVMYHHYPIHFPHPQFPTFQLRDEISDKVFEQILPFFIIFSSSISQNIEKTKLKSIFVQM